mgnify:CR=1 FL=1
MKHRRTARFVAAYQALPPEVQEQAKRAFRLFQENMSHPGLSIERLEGYPVVWSGRIKRKYRWTFHFEDARVRQASVSVITGLLAGTRMYIANLSLSHPR